MEAECPFLTFEELLNRLEDLVCDVVDRVLKSPAASIVRDLNPVGVLFYEMQNHGVVFFFFWKVMMSSPSVFVDLMAW